jgi:hypothetical protein
VSEDHLVASATVVPTDVTAWLRARGWSETGRLGDLASRWETAHEGVVVPLLPSAPDFGLRWSEMTGALSAAMHTDEQGLMLAIAKSGSDIAEFRAAGDGAIDDSIPLGDAEVLISSVRRAMTASANSVLQPRSYYGHSLPEAARDHARNVRMGQTRRGSYIVPIISRVPVLEPDEEEDAQLFQNLAYEPFARRAMVRLAQGLAALRDLTSGEEFPARSSITESVGAGVSHELCDSVANALETESIDSLDVTFSWAERLPSRAAPTQVVLEGPLAPVVREVSNILRGQQVVGQQTMVGFVKVLDRGEDDEIGKVTIRALDNDKARNVTMLLGTDDYDIASHANNERQMVSVTGQLERQPGRALRFVDVANFSPVEPMHLD